MSKNDNISKAHLSRLRKLLSPSERVERGCFIIEGLRLIEEAIKENVVFREALYTSGFEENPRGRQVIDALKASGTPLFMTSPKVVSELAGTETPQGVLAVVKQHGWNLKDIIRGNGVVAVACGLQDPGNLGTIIRTADAGGASGLIVTAGTVELYNPKVVRSTMGSIFRLPVVRIKDISDALSILKEAGYRTIATTAHSEISYLDCDYTGSCAFLIGNEASGLPEDIIQSADIRVHIPMNKGVESLNAAVSASIMIYEALRQRSLRRP